MAASSGIPTSDQDLIFRLGNSSYGIDAGKVLEVLREPRLTRVPNAPASLLGIANLRGDAMPVIALDILLGRQEASASTSRRVIVYDHRQRIGLMVDEVMRIGAVEGERLDEAELESRLAAEFRQSDRHSGRRMATESRLVQAEVVDEGRQFLWFIVAGQNYAVALDDVLEVISMPENLAAVTASDDLFLGITDYRGSVLPVVAAGRLLGLQEKNAGKSSGRIVVVDSGDSRVGLAIDRIESITRFAPDSIDEVPSILRQGHGPAEIESIARVDGGRGLVSILSAERLFGNKAIERTAMRPDGEDELAGNISVEASEQFLIFFLGSEEYGLPISAVDEVVRLPDVVTRVPNAPAFVSGLFNMRGKAVPLIDQRTRFAVKDEGVSVKSRAIVVTMDQVQVGFVVDSVSEIVGIAAGDLSRTPEFSDETGIFDRVAELGEDRRMVLLVNPRELLTRAEQDIVAALADARSGAGKH
jgi:purine-binding chemotaxis protein CheW